MSSTESFKDFVLDQLGGLEDVRVKKMFGGFGLYAGETFFGIISDDVLYFKTDEKSRTRYTEKGSMCFKPHAKQTLKNYYEAPADVIEERDVLVEWASEAIVETSMKN